MMRCIIILCLLAAPAWATTYYATNSGDWATTSNWDPNGTPGTADTVINTNSSITISNNVSSKAINTVTWTAGTLTQNGGGNGLVVSRTLTVSNATVKSINANGLFCSNLVWTAGGAWSNASLVITGNLTQDISGLLAAVFPATVINIRTFGNGTTLLVTNCIATNRCNLGILVANGSIIISNSLLYLGSLWNDSTTVTNRSWRIVDSNITLTNYAACEQGTRSVIYQSNSTVTLLFPIPYVVTNSTWTMIDSTNIVYNGSTQTSKLFSNTTTWIRSLFQFGGLAANVHPLNIVEPTINIAASNCSLAAALSVSNMVNNGGTVSTLGFTVNAATITNTAGTVIGSNSTLVCRDFINAGATFSNMTSTVQLSGNSNVTNLFNLVVGSATASLTGALVNITGTLTGAIGTALNGNNGTLNLSNPGYIAGGFSNGVATNKALTVGRSQNAGGKLNDISRRGAE